MIRHIVLWKFRPGTETEREQFLSGLAALQGVIPELKASQVVRNVGEGNYDAALISDFDSLEDLARYKADPRHQAVSAPGSPRQGHEQAQQQGGILQGGAQRTRREQVQGQEGEVEHPLQQQKSRHAPPAEPLDQNVLLPSTKAVPFSVARMRKKYNPCQQKRTAAPGKRHCGPC